MTRYMYDSVNLAGIPHVAPVKPRTIVAYYLNGKYAVKSVASVEAQFPNASLNPIDVNGTRADYARTLDVEAEDAPADICEQWITDFRADNPAYAEGAHPVIYTNRSTISSVRQGTGKWILNKDYFLWVATGDGTLYTGPGVVACQNHWYKAYDSSVVFVSWWFP